jgi:hypothetical protein
VIALRLDAHVIRHHVEHEPEPRLRERVRQRVVAGVAAELFVQRAVVGDVVAVRAASSRGQERR